MINKWKYESPIGILYLYEDGHALIGVSCDENGMDDYFLKVFQLTCEQLIIQYNKTELLFMTEQQLDEYFKGVRKEFSIPLRISSSGPLPATTNEYLGRSLGRLLGRHRVLDRKRSEQVYVYCKR